MLNKVSMVSTALKSASSPTLTSRIIPRLTPASLVPAKSVSGLGTGDLLQRCLGLAPASRLKPLEAPGAHPEAHQSKGRQAYRRGHASHLAVPALAQPYLEPGGRDRLAHADGRIAFPEFGRRLDRPGRGRQGQSVVQLHAP